MDDRILDYNEVPDDWKQYIIPTQKTPEEIPPVDAGFLLWIEKKRQEEERRREEQRRLPLYEYVPLPEKEPEKEKPYEIIIQL